MIRVEREYSEIQEYKIEKADIELRTESLIGGAEIIGRPQSKDCGSGRYKVQDDAIAFISPSPEFDSLSWEAKKIHYLNAFKKAYIMFRNEYTGSCVLVAGAFFSADGKSIITHSVNLGDSTAFLIVYDKHGKIQKQKCCMLNALHNYYNTRERAHVINQGGEFNSRKRVKVKFPYGIGSMAILGSLGDCGASGIRRIPEFTQNHIFLDPAAGEKAMLIVGCDGMTDGAFKKINSDSSTTDGMAKYRDAAVDWINQVLTPKEVLDADPKLIACRLMLSAEKKSSDNISILVQKLELNHPPLLMAVCDGHRRDYKESGSFNLVSQGTIDILSDYVGSRADSRCIVTETKPDSDKEIRDYIAIKRLKSLFRFNFSSLFFVCRAREKNNKILDENNQDNALLSNHRATRGVYPGLL